MTRPFSIEGLVFPIPAPFKDSGELDLDSLHAYCNYLLNHEASTLLVTVGTSRFNLLTRDEMKAMNQTVATCVSESGKKAKSIVSGPGPNSGSTHENVEFARLAADQGADGIIVVFPERWYGDESVIRFFEVIADQSPIPVFIHAVPMRNGFGGIHDSKPTSLSILSALAKHPNIAGLKEENGDREIFENILQTLKDDFSIIGAGGAMRRYQKDFPLGSKNYLVGIESIMPEWGHQFFNAMQDRNFEAAESIATAQEDPFFEKAVEFGWHRSLKAGLAIMGLMPPSEREPFPALEQSQVDILKQVIKQAGWSLK